MYGLKTPTYKGTNLKTPHSKSLKCSSNYKITRGSTKLYIAKSISSDISHGMNTLLHSMTSDIIKEVHIGR